jgi:hypothetical protein
MSLTWSFPDALILYRPPSRLSALIIGINRYKHSFDNFQDLSGCVVDADAVSRFLTDDLLVPPDQIVDLRNEKATRENILHELLGLASDGTIEYGDPILIYFAGYGSRANAPKAWEARGASGRIDMLLPHDFAPWTSDERNEQGISMITLTALLGKLARSKGDNIVCLSYAYIQCLSSRNCYRRSSLMHLSLAHLPSRTSIIPVYSPARRDFPKAMQ